MNDNLTITDISELICTRISHDIIGNIGAVSNAVELLEEGDIDFLDDIKSILKLSAGVLASRLKFFRMAFGLNNANLEKFDMVESVTRDYLKTIGNPNFPIELNLRVETPEVSKLAMLCVMVVADTMIKGGRVDVLEDDGRLYVTSVNNQLQSAEKIAIIKEVINGNIQDIQAQYAPVFYLKELLKMQSLHISILDKDSFGLLISAKEAKSKSA